MPCGRHNGDVRKPWLDDLVHQHALPEAISHGAEVRGSAAEFARRLEAEGGATKFKLKTDISRAVEPLKDGLTDVAREAKNVQLPDVTNASPQTLLGGLFGVVFLCTLLSAASGPSVDMRTSDGTTLEFGQRSELRQPDFGTSNRGYRPEFGNQ